MAGSAMAIVQPTLMLGVPESFEILRADERDRS
jgi:hypothetical protein